MKTYFRWPIFSLALTFSSSLFATSTQIDLTSRDSFDGSRGGSFFSKISSEVEGTTYVFKDSISIINVPTSLEVGATATCFNNTVGTLTFQGNGFAFLCKDLNFSLIPSVIRSTAVGKTVSLSGFSLLSFIRSPSEVLTTGQGTLNVADTLILSENSQIIFQKNFSKENGGAIKAKSLSLTGSTESVLFDQNRSNKRGGAIFAPDAIILSKNTGTLIFSNNSSEASGAALFTKGNLIIKDNASVSFLKNSVIGTSATSARRKLGGAICGYKTTTEATASASIPTLIFSGNKSLIFSENSSTASGGAIFVKKLDLSSGGSTVFKNNFAVGDAATRGGAIAIESGGELSLSADVGNITFEGNTVVTTDNSGVTKRIRNAISIGANGKITNLRAIEGCSIFFYDPITFENGSTSLPITTLTINAPDTTETTRYKGTIVFSGEKLTAEEAKHTDNVSSTIKQPVALVAGTLSLKSGINLITEEFTQTQKSLLLMEGGTTLSSNDDITLTRLALDLNSLSVGPAKIEVKNTSKNLTIAGPIDLIDPTSLCYENHDFRETLDLSLLNLKATGTVVHTNVPATLIEFPTAHYGYQGLWNISWSDTATTESVAKITWTKTGYIANPTRKGFLVPNSLWAAFSDVCSFQQLMENSTNAELERSVFWGTGLSNFMHKDKTKSRLGFRHIAAGYVLGAGRRQIFSDDVFRIAFCQLFGRDKDYVSTKNQGTVYGGSLYYERTRFFSHPKFISFVDEFPIVFSGHLSYLHTSNRMNTLYSTREKVRGSWGNDCLACTLGGSSLFNLSQPHLFHEVAPFIKLQFVYARQQSFREHSIEARHFGSSDLANLSLPIGVSLQKESEINPSVYDITVMYVVDMFRRNPNCATTLLISGDSWTTYAANLAHQAIVIRAENYYKFNSNFELFSQFAFELRGSSRNYNANLGGKLSF
ncbi:polymorphic outer membrane protein middle domain-containing protein [Chlamydia sp. 17-3921]|uniref:polymorphic outer membrane protein middle domain-containing protein n=1 Tax=Chlamydia sp. 17-3921 TaxID=2675798 RepID=UPI001F32C34C|nr:polymorphic outer membrane protein middle domain-containing protein [Chlamydia sp. 17-3921]